MRHANIHAARFCCADPRTLGCGCQADGQLGIFGIGSALKDLGRSIARPFESVGREISRAYDRVEDAIKPYLPAIASVVPVVGQALGPVVAQYRQVRELEKLDEAEKRYAQEELPKQLMQRACTGGMPLDCAAVSTLSASAGTAPGGFTPAQQSAIGNALTALLPNSLRVATLSGVEQVDVALRALADELRAFHNQANYKALIVAAGASPGPVLEQILIKQDQDSARWAQAQAGAQQQTVAPTQQTATGAPTGQAFPEWLPYAAAGALLFLVLDR